jgi:hypothetical protein
MKRSRAAERRGRGPAPERPTRASARSPPPRSSARAYLVALFFRTCDMPRTVRERDASRRVSTRNCVVCQMRRDTARYDASTPAIPSYRDARAITSARARAMPISSQPQTERKARYRFTHASARDTSISTSIGYAACSAPSGAGRVGPHVWTMHHMTPNTAEM